MRSSFQLFVDVYVAYLSAARYQRRSATSSSLHRRRVRGPRGMTISVSTKFSRYHSRQLMAASRLSGLPRRWAMAPLLPQDVEHAAGVLLVADESRHTEITSNPVSSACSVAGTGFEAYASRLLIRLYYCVRIGLRSTTTARPRTIPIGRFRKPRSRSDCGYNTRLPHMGQDASEQAKCMRPANGGGWKAIANTVSSHFLHNCAS